MDVGINNLNGLKTGEFVKERLRTMPALRPLVMVIKSALAQGGLNDASSSGISSYAVICMCVFFLQVSVEGSCTWTDAQFSNEGQPARFTTGVSFKANCQYEPRNHPLRFSGILFRDTAVQEDVYLRLRRAIVAKELSGMDKWRLCRFFGDTVPS
jgi:hypothetical protein